MKSKQEVIQEAWGETVYPGLDMDMKSWDEEGDGWYKHWKETGKVYRNFLNDHNKRIIDLRDDIINLNGWFWPKSLDGIENNRGWTRIESESDIPKEITECYVFDDDGDISCFTFGFDSQKDYSEVVNCGITHYQPIIKPEAPIY